MILLTMKTGTFVLLIISALALTLRLLGTNPGYPPIHPDEPKIADSAIKIAFYGDFKPVAYYYGQLLPLLYAAVNIIFFIPLFFTFVLPINLTVSLQKGHTGTFSCFLQGTDDIRHCILTRSQDFFYYLARYETAIVGSLSVLLVYLLGKRLFSTKVGVVAAFFTAVNYRHVLSSTLSLADAPLSTFALLSVLLSTTLLVNRSMKSYLLAGVGLGLTLSVKYFIYTIPTFFLCHLLSVWQVHNKISWRIRETLLALKLLLSLLVALALFLAINPFLVIDWKEAGSQLALNFHFYNISSSSVNPGFYIKSLFPIYYLFKYGIGEILSVLIAAGFVYSTFRYPKSALLLVSTILPFLYFLLVVSGANFVRNYTAIIPLLMVFPAILIIDSVHYLKIGSRTLPVLAIVVFLVGFPSLKNSFLLSSSFAKTQNQELLLNWIVDNIPNDATLAHTWGAPVPSYKPTTTINWTPWPSGFMSLEELREADVQWVAVSSEATTFTNTALWTSHNEIVKSAFVDNTFLETLFQNNYAGLVVAEIGDYRVKEFIKPFWQSADVSFFVAKVPLEWSVKREKALVTFNFEGNAQRDIWEESSFLKERRYHSTIVTGEGLNKSHALELSQTVSCEAPVYAVPALAMVSSPTFAVSPDKWYSLSGVGRREASPKYSEFKSGFMRLDFYSKDNRRLRTYVTKQLAAKVGWQDLNAAGLSPKGAFYGRVAIQVDYCNEGERYYFDELQVFVSEDSGIQKQDYPFFDVPHPKNFTWLPPL